MNAPPYLLKLLTDTDCRVVQRPAAGGVAVIVHCAICFQAPQGYGYQQYNNIRGKGSAWKLLYSTDRVSLSVEK